MFYAYKVGSDNFHFFSKYFKDTIQLPLTSLEAGSDPIKWSVKGSLIRGKINLLSGKLRMEAEGTAGSGLYKVIAFCMVSGKDYPEAITYLNNSLHKV